MFRARFETRNFTFDGYGETEAAAVKALWAGWFAHCDVYTSADRELMADDSDDIGVYEFQSGHAYRDNEEIT